jgi:hypothetical protein
MKATLEFTLPEEKREHLRAATATDLALALQDIREGWRKMCHDRGDDFKVTVEEVFTSIRESLDDYGINLEELL